MGELSVAEPAAASRCRRRRIMPPPQHLHRCWGESCEFDGLVSRVQLMVLQVVLVSSLFLFRSASDALFPRDSLMPLRRFKSATGSPHPDARWEAFSFELIPFNAHYTMLQADFFNGDRSEPAPPLPTYSWDDEKSISFDTSKTWGARNVRQSLPSVYVCDIQCRCSDGANGSKR